MSDIVVSISCLAYNHAPYIRQCLDGFLMQKTDFRYEVIIHDDASNDDTAEIIREYHEKYPEIFYPIFQKENQYSKGVKPTWVFNAPRWRGKYIAFCEGDDYWTDPKKLQKQVDFLDKNEDFAVCFTNQLVLTENGELISENEYIDKVYTTADIISGFIPGTQTLLIRRYENLFDIFSKYIDMYSGDRLLCYCCSLFGKLHLINDFTAAYRQTGSGIWTSIDTERQFLMSIEEFIKFHKVIGLPVNNIYIHDRLNGAFFYWIRKKPKSIFNLMRNISKIKKKYCIKSNFILYFFTKVFRL